MTTNNERDRFDDETLLERVRRLEKDLTERDTTNAALQAENTRLRGEHGRSR